MVNTAAVPAQQTTQSTPDWEALREGWRQEAQNVLNRGGIPDGTASIMHRASIEQLKNTYAGIREARMRQEIQNQRETAARMQKSQEWDKIRPQREAELKAQGLRPSEISDILDRQEVNYIRGAGAYEQIVKRNAQTSAFTKNPNAIINETARQEAIAKAQDIQKTRPQEYERIYSQDFKATQPKTKNLFTEERAKALEGFRGSTTDKSGKFKTFTIEEKGRLLTLNPKGEVVAIQNKNVYVDLRSGQARYKDTGKNLSPLKEKDVKALSTLGVNTNLPIQEQAKSDYYYKGLEEQAQKYGAANLASSVDSTLRYSLGGADVVQETKTAEGYTIKLAPELSDEPNYVQFFQKAVAQAQAANKYADVVKVSPTEYRIIQKQPSTAAYTYSKSFGGKDISNISLEGQGENKIDLLISFEGGDEVKYSELDQTKKEAVKSVLSSELSTIKQNFLSQYEKQVGQTGLSISEGQQYFRVQGLDFPKSASVKFEEQGEQYVGEPTITYESGKEVKLSELPEDKRQNVLLAFGGFSQLEKNLEEQTGQDVVVKEGKLYIDTTAPKFQVPKNATIKDAIKVASQAYDYTKKIKFTLVDTKPQQQENALDLYDKKIQATKTEAKKYDSSFAEDFAKWGYTWGGIKMIPVALAQAGQNLNVAFTDLEYITNTDIPLVGNLSLEDKYFTQQKLNKEAELIGEEATLQYRKLQSGITIGERLGFATSPTATAALGGLALTTTPVAGVSASLQPFARATTATAATTTAAPPSSTILGLQSLSAGQAAQQFVIGGTIAATLDETAKTITIPSYRPLQKPEDTAKTFIAGGASSVLFGATKYLSTQGLNIVPKAGALGFAEEATKRIGSSMLAGGVAGASYSTYKNVLDQKPVDIPTAQKYALVGAAVGGAFEAYAFGAQKGILPTIGVGRIDYKEIDLTKKTLGGQYATKTHSYVGAYYQRGQFAQPIIGAQDMRPVIGTPNLYTSSTSLFSYPTPITPFETRILTKAQEQYFKSFDKLTPTQQAYLSKEVDTFLQQGGKDVKGFKEYLKDYSAVKTRYTEGQKLLRETYNKPNPQETQLSLKDVLKKSELLGKEGAPEKLYDLLQKYKLGVGIGGSVEQKMYLGGSMSRNPADIDLYSFKQAPSDIIKDFYKQLKPIYGSNIKIDETTAGRILINQGGTWRHGIEIHPYYGSGTPSGGSNTIILSNEYLGYGYPSQGFITTKEGLLITQLSEQGVRKGASTLGSRIFGYAPEAHRAKDIVDFISVAEFKGADVSAFKATIPNEFFSNFEASPTIVSPYKAYAPYSPAYGLAGTTAAYGQLTQKQYEGKYELPKKDYLLGETKYDFQANYDYKANYKPSYTYQPAYSYAKDYTYDYKQDYKYEKPYDYGYDYKPSYTSDYAYKQDYKYEKPYDYGYKSDYGYDYDYKQNYKYNYDYKYGYNYGYGYDYGYNYKPDYKYEYDYLYKPELPKQARQPFKIGRKKKRKYPRKIGVRSLYADLFSVAKSQRKYGTATQPSLVKRPYLWQRERGTIPTAEQLDAKQPRRPKRKLPSIGTKKPPQISNRPKRNTISRKKVALSRNKLTLGGKRKRLKIT